MSKERRVDPQVTVGLLTDRSGFPLAVHLFEGNKAETKTLIPVLTAFRDAAPGRRRHRRGRRRRDAVGGEPARAGGGRVPVHRRLEDQQGARTTWPSISSGTATPSTTGRPSRPPAPWAPARTPASRRVVYQWSFKRYRHDIQAINAMIERAEAVAAGNRPLKKDRFVKITDAATGRGLGPGRARPLPGRAEGLRHQHRPPTPWTAPRSSRPTTTSTRSNAPSGWPSPTWPPGPMFHRLRDSIEAHLTIVFAALAVSREAQARTGLSHQEDRARRCGRCAPRRSASAGQQITAATPHPRRRPTILDDLTQGGH